MPDMSIPAQPTAVTDAALASLRQQRHIVVRTHTGAGKTGGATSGTVRPLEGDPPCPT